MEHLKPIIKELKPGETTFVQGDENEIRSFAVKNNLSVKARNNVFILKNEPTREKSNQAIIKEALSEYMRGTKTLPIGHMYVRQIVSLYNKKNGTSFKVTQDAEGMGVIFQEVENYSQITVDEFRTLEKKYQDKIAELSTRIVPNESIEHVENETKDDDELI